MALAHVPLVISDSDGEFIVKEFAKCIPHLSQAKLVLN